MATATINLKLDADAASVLKGASREDRDKLCLLVSLVLQEYKSCPTPLQELMDEIGRKARSRGLTAAKLESILHGD